MSSKLHLKINVATKVIDGIFPSSILVAIFWWIFLNLLFLDLIRQVLVYLIIMISRVSNFVILLQNLSISNTNKIRREMLIIAKFSQKHYFWTNLETLKICMYQQYITSYLSLYKRQILSLSTFNFLATNFFSSSTESFRET